MNRNNNLIEFPDKTNYLFLDGPSGKLELLASPCKTPSLVTNTEVVAIICHPHPLHEGTMNNKVVHTLHKAFNDYGFNTVRFNFRGVGRSEGTFGNSIGEYEDLLSVIAWVNTVKPNCKIILAGFSFGAFIALKASKDIDCMQLISVAPAVHHQDYVGCMPIKCPWLVIQGEQDEIVPPKQVYQLINSLDNKPDVISFPDATHFFHGKLVELKEKIMQYLQNQISN